MREAGAAAELWMVFAVICHFLGPVPPRPGLTPMTLCDAAIFFPIRGVLNTDARLRFRENHAEVDLVPYKTHIGAPVYKSMTAAAYRMWRRQVAPLNTWISSVGTSRKLAACVSAASHLGARMSPLW